MRAPIIVTLLTLLVACRLDEHPREVAAARAHEATPQRFGVGRPPTDEELAAMDVDVDSTGAGLPAGRGDAARGAELYRQKCAACHGLRGEGIRPNPALVTSERRDGFTFGTDPSLVRTIGNYWPFAPTLFDYIRRTMPLTEPGSLTTSEVYSLTAYLLAANGVIPEGSTLDSASLVAVRMPARDRFVPDERRGGPTIR
ncbi:MAG TPA: cytochrome c [Gemmatimonadaceae bacterium]